MNKCGVGIPFLSGDCGHEGWCDSPVSAEPQLQHVPLCIIPSVRYSVREWMIMMRYIIALHLGQVCGVIED